MTDQTVMVPDGYNGHTIRMCANPIEEMGKLVKLRCAVLGKEYLICWLEKDRLAALIKDQRHEDSR